MNLSYIKQLLLAGESSRVEFKTCKNKVDKDFWKTYSAFANTHGGEIILGVSEKDGNFTLEGVNNPQKIIDDIYSTASDASTVNLNLLNDNVHKILLDDSVKYIIYVNVPEAASHEKPVFLHRDYNNSYIRKNTGDYKMSLQELSSILRNQIPSLDTKPLDNYSIDDLDNESMLKYKSLLAQRNPEMNFLDLTNHEFLLKLGAITHDKNDGNKLKLTLGALLFFGKYNSIRSYLPHYHVDYFDKRGDNDRWSDRVDAGNFNFPEMNLLNYYLIVTDKLYATVEVPFVLGEDVVRKPAGDLKIALRELFVNMITHADYISNTTSIKVEVHKPYYIFSNPGIMGIPIEDFFKTSKSNPRNTILVALFTRLGAAERAGSGSQKIIKVVRDNRYELPQITTSLDGTTIKLWSMKKIDLSNEVTLNERLVFNFIEGHLNKIGGVSKKEIQEAFPNLTGKQLTTILNHLTTLNFIQKIGGNRNRTYMVAINTLDIINSLDKISKLYHDSLSTK